MYNEVKNWYEPVDSLREFGLMSEMTRWESGFLCGLLKRFRPHKILEVGVAAGGTSVILGRALEMLGLDQTMHYSGDLSEKYYQPGNGKLKTGYQYEIACEEKIISKGNHKLFTGKYLPEYIDEIGNGIDFIILDTMHIAPGELLDVLIALPYLSLKAVIVFHDLAIDHQNKFRPFYCINKCLFDSLDGEKYFNVSRNDIDTCMLYGYSDIGGVIIENRDNCIRDLFSMFGLPWAYMLSDRELDIYRKKYMEMYDDKYLELFDLLVKVQKKTWNERSSLGAKQNIIVHFKERLLKQKTFLYGNGKRGKKFNKYIKLIGGNIAGWIVSDGYRTEKQMDGLPVYTLSELEAMEGNKLVIVASSYIDVLDNIEKSGMEYYIPDQFLIEQMALYENV